MSTQPSIFISYRRKDALGLASQIQSDLAWHLHGGKDAIFFDYKNLRGGDEWDEKLQSAIRGAKIVLFVIEDFTKWYDVDKYGDRRIDEPKCPVRNEIQISLESNRFMIPILCNKPSIPPEEKQPEIVKVLLKKQVIYLETTNFESDIKKLADRICQLVPELKQQHASAPRLKEYFKHTADRRVSFGHFRSWLIHQNNSAQRTHFFFLSGHQNHTHEGIFKRIVLALEGKDTLHEKLNVDYEVRHYKINIKQPTNLDGIISEVIFELMDILAVPRTAINQVQNKNLGYVLNESTLIKDLKKHDKLCIHCVFEKDAWDPEITPSIAKAFIEGFCNGGVTQEHPQVLFFFSIEEDGLQNKTMITEIQEAINRSEHLYDLGSLDLVTARDIEDWFRDYSTLDRIEMDKMRTATFGDLIEPQFMYLVEHKLEDVISQINKNEEYENRNTGSY